MACKGCEWKGYILAPSGLNPENIWVHKCQECKDVRRYSDAVQQLCGFKPPTRGPAKIIPLRKAEEYELPLELIRDLVSAELFSGVIELKTVKTPRVEEDESCPATPRG